MRNLFINKNYQYFHMVSRFSVVIILIYLILKARYFKVMVSGYMSDAIENIEFTVG